MKIVGESASATLHCVARPTRRRFLWHAATAATAACFCPRSVYGATSSPNLTFPTAPRDRIAIASYPFRDFITAGDTKPGATSRIDLKDFAAHVKEKFGISRIEPWTGHFPASDPKYLEQFRTAVEKAGAHIVNIAVDGQSSP